MLTLNFKIMIFFLMQFVEKVILKKNWNYKEKSQNSELKL